jgi:hypothetical protein
MPFGCQRVLQQLGLRKLVATQTLVRPDAAPQKNHHDSGNHYPGCERHPHQYKGYRPTQPKC